MDEISVFVQQLLLRSSSSSSSRSQPHGMPPASAQSTSPENLLMEYSLGCNVIYGGVELPETTPLPPIPCSSSKRRRTAEVHNQSEKRRRSRINEKLRALQSLIPNSNKTDKASMLDEAIDYVKQLQLEVQMISMRNGFNMQSMSQINGMQGSPSPYCRFQFGEENQTMNRWEDLFRAQAENRGCSS